MIGQPMGARDVQVRGWLALTDLPDALQAAEDATADADRTRWDSPRQLGFITGYTRGVGRWFERPATDTERLLLADQGHQVPAELTTRVHYRNVLRHRSWPQIEAQEATP